jgi:enterochelin esterase family protein
MSRYRGIARALLVAAVFLSIQQSAWSQPPAPAKDVFGPDSIAQPGVPEGKIEEFHAPDSRTFPGFVHDWWLYTPAQYTPAKPAALMIFQDGADFVKRDGHWRLPVVLDNLIAHGQLPVIAAVFVNPGASTGHRDGKPINSNRSVEYDTLSPAYATFLWTEILPEVRQHVHLREDASARAIGGCSSGGIASLTAAWQFPDRFRKVLSLSGSYANIRGGQVYPRLIRGAARKPIRVFQQVGAHDAVVEGWGSWLELNQAVSAALDEKHYDHKFVMTGDTHCGVENAAQVPQAMRWLWRDYPR